MIIQAISYGKAEEPFAFTYSGDFTDNRVDGIGTVRLNTSGTLTVTGSPVTVTATIVGAGGGASLKYYSRYYISNGGGGGNQTVEVTIEPGTYEIVIGTGGAGTYSNASTIAKAGNGGNTTAFGYTSTGGKGIAATGTSGGSGGTPNGIDGGYFYGSYFAQPAKAEPNGGVVQNSPATDGYAGGDGYVELTFS